MTTLFHYSLFILSLFSATLFSSINGGFSRESEVLNKKTEKLSHLHFYFHDVISGKNQSAAIIINHPNPKSLFGETSVIDDALTIERDPKSKTVGRAQGLYSVATQRGLNLLMVVNFVFIEGKYNGSSISIMGRNSVMDKVRELPIVGGTGFFRFARGFALARTASFGPVTAVVEYDVYVLHY